MNTFTQPLDAAYRAPWFLPGGHAQTIVPALWGKTHYSRETVVTHYARERWTAPDEDFIDVDFSKHAAVPNKPFVLLFHGLEGSSASPYARAFLRWCEQRQMGFAVAHFRGCSGSINLAPRAYHSGDWQELDWIIRRLHARLQASQTPLLIVGVSMGGNALLRWAQELGNAATQFASAIAAVCSPIDLAAGGHAIGRGLNRHIYTRNFLSTMIPRALARLELHPGLFDAQALKGARDLYEFDNLFTAPVHGFRNTEHYWEASSAKPHLHTIRLPALVLNARNDPFVPAVSLPQQAEVGPYVQLCQPATGGHVGFPAGALPPSHVDALPRLVGDWLLAQI